MADPVRTPAQAPDAEPAAFGTPSRPLRGIAIAVGAVAIAGIAWFVWVQVREGRREDRWDDLYRLQERAGRGDENHREWLFSHRKEDALERDEYIRKLEEFLAKHGDDDVVAAHVHALLHDLEQTQVLALSPTATKADIRKRYDRAEAHLKAIIEKHPDFPLNWGTLKPTGEAAGFSSLAKLLLAKLQENRKWEDEHGLEAVESDPDVVLLVRTSRGDLRLRPYSKTSPALVKSFVDRACRGEWDGTAFFAKRDQQIAEKYVRAGDPRTKKLDASDKDRVKWGESGPDDPLPYSDGRHRVLHVRGTVSAWHEDNDDDDETTQFLVTTADSADLNYEYTPFAKVEEASLPALDRIASVPTFQMKDPAIVSNVEKSRLQDQFVKPVRIAKVLVYEKGELKGCHPAGNVRESERKLSTLVPDEDLVKEEPPAPPTAPPAPQGMGESPMDEPPMNGAGMGG